MESIGELLHRLMVELYIEQYSFPRRSAMVFKDGAPLVIPREPEVLPVTKPDILPRPGQDDPFNVPAPLIDPTPKGSSFFSF